MLTVFTKRRKVAGAATPEAAALAKPLSRAGRLGRKALKRFLYGQMALMQGFLIAIGKEKPYVRFTVEADPPSIYWVFRLKPEVVDGLGRRLGLPAGFESTPMRCTVNDAPAHLLTLNVYRVSGLAKGIRAEWSMYVADADGAPRYMVVDARSSKGSMDPVDVITRSSRVEHVRVGDVVTTMVGEPGSSFAATVTMPNPDDGTSIAPAPEFVTANDYIYWGNGICDRTFYDKGMAFPSQLVLPGEGAVFTDETPWAQLVEPEPAHVVVFRDAIELVVSPWHNLDRM